MHLFALKIPETLPEDTFDRLLHHLPEAGQARVRKFRHEADSIRSLAGRLLPTWYLRHAGLVPLPTHPGFAHGSRGKPYLSTPAVSPGIDFNTSHEGRYVLLAVVRGAHAEVGVDVMDLPEDPDELAESIGYQLTSKERLELAGTWGKVKAKVLTTLWTVKEGFTKANGQGISFGLDRIEVNLGDGQVAGVTVDGEDVREQGWAWKVGSLDDVDYGWAVIWRGDDGGDGPAGDDVIQVETLPWDDFVRSFIGQA